MNTTNVFHRVSTTAMLEWNSERTAKRIISPGSNAMKHFQARFPSFVIIISN